MKSFINLLILIIISFTGFGATNTERITTKDFALIGNKSSSANKGIAIEKGDGTKAYLRANISGQKFEKSFDNGATYTGLSGEGGSTGGLNNLDNPNFEDGISQNWTNTGATYAVSSTTYQGSISASFTGQSSANTLCSDPKLLIGGLLGVSGEARIYYNGGDANYTLKVIDADSDVIASLVLQVHSTYGYESIGFLFPQSTDTTNDKTLKLCIEHTAASPSTAMEIDEAYLGRNIDLGEATTPDVFSGTFTPPGTIDRQNSDIFTSFSESSTGINVIQYQGLTVAPSCTCTGVDATGTGLKCEIRNTISSSSMVAETFSSGTTRASVDSLSVVCQKQGADAKQQVQVYKSIPKAAQNSNEFSVKISNAGVVSDENIDWINGNCTAPGSGVFTCTVNSGVFSDAPNCVVSTNVGAIGYSAQIYSVAAGSITINTFNAAGAGSDVASILKCSKNGTDHKTPTVQPILVKQVDTSYQQGSRDNSCVIIQSSNTMDNILCSSWLDSISHVGTGITTMTIKSGVCSDEVICEYTAAEADRSCTHNGAGTSSTTATMGCTDMSGTDQDVTVFVRCSCAR